MRPHVEQMKSANGNPVQNQFLIYTADGVFFQSYRSIIAFRANDGKVTLDADKWDYSVTTGKYRNAFLGEGIADTRRKIKSGEYQLAAL